MVGFLRLCSHFAAVKKKDETSGSQAKSDEEIKVEQIDIKEELDLDIGQQIDKMLEPQEKLVKVEVNQVVDIVPSESVLNEDVNLESESDVDIEAETPVPHIGQTQYENIFLQNYFNPPTEKLLFPFRDELDNESESDTEESEYEEENDEVECLGEFVAKSDKVIEEIEIVDEDEVIGDETVLSNGIECDASESNDANLEQKINGCTNEQKQNDKNQEVSMTCQMNSKVRFRLFMYSIDYKILSFKSIQYNK